MEVPVTISVIRSGVTVVKLTLSQLITSARDVRSPPETSRRVTTNTHTTKISGLQLNSTGCN